ncbi:MAG: tetratricopeptide repeat protein, partial [Bacteroidetes bacterium]|nr:tetratricopeptide repeat protein [Bacteroidota bacterium]
GNLYNDKNETRKAIDHYNTSLKIYIKAFRSFHPDVGDNYNKFANLYAHQKTYKVALQYYQKAMQSLVKAFSDSNVYVNPTLPTIYQIKEGKFTVNSMPYLLDALEGKAQVFEDKWKDKL